MKKLVFRACLACLATLGAARADPPSPLLIASLLFPQSTSWATADSLPALKPADLNEQFAESLWSAIQDHSDEAVQDVPGCMASMRLFYADGAAAFFHSITLGARHALFYSGDANCREGELTIVWPNIALDANTIAQILPAQLLRIAPGAAPAVTAIAPACCGGLLDEYILTNLLQLGTQTTWEVENDLQIPKNTQPAAHVTETLKSPLTLRRDPSLNNAYDPGFSQVLNTAALGNIERQYLPGAQVTQLATWHDPKGETWRLLAVPDDRNAPLCTYAATTAEIGWSN